MKICIFHNDEAKNRKGWNLDLLHYTDTPWPTWITDTPCSTEKYRHTSPYLDYTDTPCPTWNAIKTHLALPGNALQTHLLYLKYIDTPCPTWNTQTHLALLKITDPPCQLMGRRCLDRQHKGRSLETGFLQTGTTSAGQCECEYTASHVYHESTAASHPEYTRPVHHAVTMWTIGYKIHLNELI